MTIRSPQQGGRGEGRTQGERGAVLVEFSLVVVLFVALLYGLIAYGMAFALKESMTNAVSEAARSAVGASQGDEANVAWQEAKDRLGWLKDARCCERVGDPTSPDKPMEITATKAACTTDANKQCMTVDAHYDYSGNPLVPVLQLPGFSFLFPDEINTTATVRLPDTTTSNP